jgi:hypothetical protein
VSDEKILSVRFRTVGLQTPFLPELVYLMNKNKYELQRFLAEEIIPTKKDFFPKHRQKHAVIAVFYMV